MRPSVLVIYYSQTGQLRNVLDSVLADMSGKVDITYAEIKPIQPFPFPWSATTFFDAMPETVMMTPIPVSVSPELPANRDFDLVILGYQPWFLHPSQPINSFLESNYAKILRGKPVITVVGCRNMWLNAQEQVKRALKDLDASLVGNIVLTDRHTNLISLLTIIRWSFKGEKEASGLLPEAGICATDIADARRFGTPIYNHLVADNLIDLHRELREQKAVELNPGLVLLELRGLKNFRFWAHYISEKGGPGALARLPRVKNFQRLLMVAIFILSPISSFSAFIKLQLNKRKLMKDVAYFQQLAYEPERM